MTNPTLTVDPELKGYLPALDEQTKGLLEDSIKQAGKAREPIEVWKKGEDLIIIDGHNRYEICTRLKLPFEVREVSFKNKEEAKKHMLDVQLTRRNLSKEEAAQFRAQFLRMTKRRAAANGGSMQDATKQAAAATGVGEATIKRDDQFTRGVEKLKQVHPEEATKVGKGKSKVNRGSVEALGKATTEAAEKVAMEKIEAEIKREHKKAPVKAPSAPSKAKAKANGSGASPATPAPTPAPTAPQGKVITDRQQEVLDTLSLFMKAPTPKGRLKLMEKLVSLMGEEDGETYAMPAEFAPKAKEEAKVDDVLASIGLKATPVKDIEKASGPELEQGFADFKAQLPKGWTKMKIEEKRDCFRALLLGDESKEAAPTPEPAPVQYDD